MAVKPYKLLIDSALKEFRDLGPGLMGEGPKIPAPFRFGLGSSSPVSKFFEDAGMDPDFFENWWWLLTTLAEIHYKSQSKKDAWNSQLGEQLVEAVAFVKLKYPDLSNVECCRRLMSYKRIARIKISKTLGRKIDKTKHHLSLYRQLRYAIEELQELGRDGDLELFVPTAALKVISRKPRDAT
ncbi:hypothetical protein [Bradyrhizobium sp. B117]|uniref:hypothetical protein n=1 Tax=Bradyrhizobium sp. B117 TaxID=3140246 RepID=UPI003183E331